MQFVEVGIQIAVVVLSLLSGHVTAAVLNGAALAFLMKKYTSGKIKLDSLELWKLLPQAKQYNYIKMGLFGAAFAFTMFR